MFSKILHQILSLLSLGVCLTLPVPGSRPVLAADSLTGLDALTPLAAVQIAFERHPALLEQRERKHELAALKGQAVATALPKITANLSTIRNRNPGLLNSPNFSQLTGDGDPGGEFPFDPDFLKPIPVTTYDYNLGIEQTIYSFGRVGAAINTARIQAEQIDEEIRSAEVSVARDAVVALYGLAVAQAGVEVLAAEREALERQVQQAQDFLDIGTGTRLQYLQAKSALTRLRPREINARGSVDIARVALNEALGLDVGEVIEPAPGLLSAQALDPLPGRSALMTSIAQRPDLRAMQIERRSLGEQSKVWRATTLPSISFRGAYGISTIFTGELTNLEFSNWNVGVFLEWSFFDGFETRHKLAQIHSQQVQNRYREDTLRARYQRDLVAQEVEYNRAREAADAAREGVAEAEETLRVAEDSYQWGAATSLDILQAQQALTEARFQTLQAVHDALVAFAEIQALTGLFPNVSHEESGSERP